MKILLKKSYDNLGNIYINREFKVMKTLPFEGDVNDNEIICNVEKLIFDDTESEKLNYNYYRVLSKVANQLELDKDELDLDVLTITKDDEIYEDLICIHK